MPSNLGVMPVFEQMVLGEIETPLHSQTVMLVGMPRVSAAAAKAAHTISSGPSFFGFVSAVKQCIFGLCNYAPD